MMALGRKGICDIHCKKATENKETEKDLIYFGTLIMVNLFFSHYLFLLLRTSELKTLSFQY
jgi:hypothetical protein